MLYSAIIFFHFSDIRVSTRNTFLQFFEETIKRNFLTNAKNFQWFIFMFFTKFFTMPWYIQTLVLRKFSNYFVAVLNAVSFFFCGCNALSSRKSFEDPSKKSVFDTFFYNCSHKIKFSRIVFYEFWDIYDKNTFQKIARKVYIVITFQQNHDFVSSKNVSDQSCANNITFYCFLVKCKSRLKVVFLTISSYE